MGVIVLAGVLLTAGQASAGTVEVRTDGHVQGASGYAKGLLIPGRGPEFTREEMVDAVRGVDQCVRRCRYKILLTFLGERSLIAVKGPGYPPDGLLHSSRTRIPGLISIYDVQPTVEALDRGEEPPITARDETALLNETHLRGSIAKLSRRLEHVDNSRIGAGLGMAALIAGFTLVAALRRSAFFGRAALLTVPVGLSTALALSALEVTRPWVAVPLLIAVSLAGALVAARLTTHPYALAACLLAIFPIYLVVLALSQETSSLAVIGPRPENGGRFYGFNNQLETLVLVSAFLGAALLGRRVLPLVAALALVTVGATFAGADGGGVIVLIAGFLFLWFRLRNVPLTARNLALAGGAVVALGLIFVGLDAALGGESHVTRSLGGGPDQLAEDILDRLQASVEGVFSSWHSAVVILVSLPVLVWLALRRPRYAVLDALLVALAVSLLVNDAPREVSGFGALSALALRFWCESDERVE